MTPTEDAATDVWRNFSRAGCVDVAGSNSMSRALTQKVCNRFIAGRSKMLRILLLAGLMTAIGSPAWAVVKCADVKPSDGGTRVTLADYQKAGSCQVSDKIFSSFKVNVVDKDDVILTGAQWIAMTTVGDSSSEPGLKFSSVFGSAIWTVIGGFDAPNEFKMQITYSVATVSGKKLIKDAILSVPNTTPLGVEGAGSKDTVDESLSIPAMLHTIAMPDGVAGTKLTDSTTFTPVATVMVSDVVDVLAGKLGKASLSSFTSQISEVPEPSTWAMMLVGFAGLGYAAFRRGRGARRGDATA
jgi:PEP-CTERM motif